MHVSGVLPVTLGLLGGTVTAAGWPARFVVRPCRSIRALTSHAQLSYSMSGLRGQRPTYPRCCPPRGRGPWCAPMFPGGRCLVGIACLVFLCSLLLLCLRCWLYWPRTLRRRWLARVRLEFLLRLEAALRAEQPLVSVPLLLVLGYCCIVFWALAVLWHCGGGSPWLTRSWRWVCSGCGSWCGGRPTGLGRRLLFAQGVLAAVLLGICAVCALASALYELREDALLSGPTYSVVPTPQRAAQTGSSPTIVPATWSPGCDGLSASSLHGTVAGDLTAAAHAPAVLAGVLTAAVGCWVEHVAPFGLRPGFARTQATHCPVLQLGYAPGVVTQAVSLSLASGEAMCLRDRLVYTAPGRHPALALSELAQPAAAVLSRSSGIARILLARGSALERKLAYAEAVHAGSWGVAPCARFWSAYLPMLREAQQLRVSPALLRAERLLTAQHVRVPAAELVHGRVSSVERALHKRVCATSALMYQDVTLHRLFGIWDATTPAYAVNVIAAWYRIPVIIRLYGRWFLDWQPPIVWFDDIHRRLLTDLKEPWLRVGPAVRAASATSVAAAALWAQPPVVGGRPVSLPVDPRRVFSSVPEVTQFCPWQWYGYSDRGDVACYLPLRPALAFGEDPRQLLAAARYRARAWQLVPAPAWAPAGARPSQHGTLGAAAIFHTGARRGSANWPWSFPELTTPGYILVGDRPLWRYFRNWAACTCDRAESAEYPLWVLDNFAGAAPWSCQCRGATLHVDAASGLDCFAGLTSPQSGGGGVSGRASCRVSWVSPTDWWEDRFYIREDDNTAGLPVPYLTGVGLNFAIRPWHYYETSGEDEQYWSSESYVADTLFQTFRFELCGARPEWPSLPCLWVHSFGGRPYVGSHLGADFPGGTRARLVASFPDAAHDFAIFDDPDPAGSWLPPAPPRAPTQDWLSVLCSWHVVW